MDAGLGRSRTLPPGVESELKLNFSLLLWAPSELTSRQGGRGRPGRLGFLSSSDSLPPSPPPHPFSPPRRVGRPPPFVSRLAYLHVNAAPVPARLEVALATLGTGSVRELFFFSDPRGHYRPGGEGAVATTTIWPGLPWPPGIPCPSSR